MDDGQSTHPVTVLVLLHFCTSTCFPMFYSCALISRSSSWLIFEREIQQYVFVSGICWHPVPTLYTMCFS